MGGGVREKMPEMQTLGRIFMAGGQGSHLQVERVKGCRAEKKKNEWRSTKRLKQ